MSALSYTIQVPTAYGPMLISRHDLNQTWALLKTGRAIDAKEIEVLRHLLALEDQPVFIDVGANFGTYSLALAPVCSRVYAFEPQRPLFNMICGSAALGAVDNLIVRNMCVGDSDLPINVPKFDYHAELNFGSIEFGYKQGEKLSQERGVSTELVPQTTLDKLGLRADLIKIDVEGMEQQVLNGATETISRCRPILFVEHLKSDGPALCDWISARNYKVIIWGMNLLCLPQERSYPSPEELGLTQQQGEKK